MFGDLDDVIGRMIVDLDTAGYSWTDKPMCPGRQGASRYNVTIDNPDYESLVGRYPANSPNTSLRRLVYWFVDNEIYDELGWEPTRRYRTPMTKRGVTSLEKSVEYLERATLYINEKTLTDCITTIRSIIKDYE